MNPYFLISHVGLPPYTTASQHMIRGGKLGSSDVMWDWWWTKRELNAGKVGSQIENVDRNEAMTWWEIPLRKTPEHHAQNVGRTTCLNEL